MLEAKDTECNVFRKSDNDAIDVEFINPHLSNEHEKHMWEDQNPVTEKKSN